MVKLSQLLFAPVSVCLVLVRDKLKQSKFDQKYYKSYLGLEIKTNVCHLVAISISFDTIICNIVIMLWKVSVHIAIHTRLDFTWYAPSSEFHAFFDCEILRAWDQSYFLSPNSHFTESKKNLLDLPLLMFILSRK